MTGVPSDQKNKKVVHSKGKTPSKNLKKTLPPILPPPFTVSNASCVLQGKSSETEAQRVRALELLKISPQTTYTLRAKGVSHCAAHIMELRLRGHRIDTSRVTAVDSDGYTHVGVALYSLEVPQWPNS